MCDSIDRADTFIGKPARAISGSGGIEREMIRFSARETGPWRLVVNSIVIVLLAVGSVGLVGVVENARVKDAAEGAIEYDVAVADIGDDLRVAVLNLRDFHRNIVFSGPSESRIADFDTAYDQLLFEIDRLERIDVSRLNVPQPAELRQFATDYHDAFRPRIVLFTSDPIAFNNASAAGLAQLEQLDAEAVQIAEAGEQLTSHSLERVERAASRERIILISLLIGVALLGITLSLSAGRILDRLRTANLQEQEAGQRLANALKMKSDFIADASHELRTPLTLIRGNAEIGLASKVDSARDQALTEILSESRRMSRLVDDLLFLARSDSGVPSVEREYVPVRWLLSRLAAPAEAMTRHHETCLTADLQGEGYVEVDPERIQQAVLILVDNASRYSPADACVELHSVVADDTLTIAVQDHGPGVAEDEQPLIFERFYQVGPGRTRQRGGSGLGLAIARSIVEAHKGTIGVTSEPGQGTTMTISLPLTPGAVSQARRQIKSAGGAGAPRCRTAHIPR